MAADGGALPRRLLAPLAALPAVALAAWQATFVWPFFSDDSFISLRFAQRLLAGDGLTWTDGERVEGYSNLLWVLLTAALGATGLDLVTAARALGFLCTLLALFALARAMRPHDLRSALVAALPPLLVAASQPVLVWTLGGLEGPLLLLLLCLGFGGLLRTLVVDETTVASLSPKRLLWLGVPFALACWTRPDAPLWALTAGCGLAVARARDGLATMLRTALWFGLPALLAVAAQLVFRLAYYGDYVPNTAHVKAEFDPASFGPGGRFVWNALLVMPGITLAAVVGAALLALRRRTRAFVLVPLLPVLAWLSYLTAIGGDHFPGLRLFHGALAPLAVLAAAGLLALRSANARVALAVVTIAAAAVDVWQARTDRRSREARGEVWEWRGQVVGDALRAAFAERQPLLAVDAAGAVPFFSGLPALDMLGLCDRTIATTPFADWLDTTVPGTPKPPGHLRGNGDYVMLRAPDLLLFNNPPGLPAPVFVSACEFEEDPRFVDGYRLVMLDLGEQQVLPALREPLRVPLWVRVDGRAGVRREPGRVVVPAWLFGALRSPGRLMNRYQPPGPSGKNLAIVGAHFQAMPSAAVPVGDGAWALRSQVGDVQLTLPLEAGRYRARVEPTESGASIDDVIDVTAPGDVTLTLRCPPDARPQRVVLERSPN